MKLTNQTEGSNDNAWGTICDANFEEIDGKLGDLTSISIKLVLQSGFTIRSQGRRTPLLCLLLLARIPMSSIAGLTMGFM